MFQPAAGNLRAVEVADSVLDLVGNTPLVRMRRAIDDLLADLDQALA